MCRYPCGAGVIKPSLSKPSAGKPSAGKPSAAPSFLGSGWVGSGPRRLCAGGDGLGGRAGCRRPGFDGLAGAITKGYRCPRQPPT